MSSILRSMARDVATYNMKDAGVLRPHEKIGGRSWFAENWRQWVKRSKQNAKKAHQVVRRGATR